FCRTHKIELIFKPMAKERGYPGSIDFDQLKERLVLFKHDLESIIDRQTPSSFLELAQNEFKNKGIQARNAIEVMKRFEQTLPGYYGHKGSNAMMDTLSDLFLKTGYLDDKKSEPLKPIEFVQQVLVPECGIRLIQQDLRVSFEEAKKVMRESEEYGSTVYS
ncbi:RTC4-like domain-containing protein, partial [Gilbertella persicaria]|uniref:RTC4-like domain-containing protein n=1 Tax=Gilbertella persicaria TaxID=101096 RepID=UPI00221EA4DD